MNVLVTGGTGYIGSHTIIELLTQGHTVVVVDNLINSTQESLRRVETITKTSIPFYALNLQDKDLDKIFTAHAIDAVIHFAGLKSVNESTAHPLMYYTNNLESTLSLLAIMERHKVKKLIFSSSAAVYGVPEKLPVREDNPKSPAHPYGQTKLMIEQILGDLVQTKAGWNITALRYFNPIGAHESGLIGDDPHGIPNNLLPYITQVASDTSKTLPIFGDDYDTPDGTGVRDFIHVVDLARAHAAALQHLNHPDLYKAYNVGTGHGSSVLEMVEAVKKASKKPVNYQIMPRRDGDIASSYADVTLINKELGWKASLTIDEACASAWKWQTLNPNGYSS